MKKFDRHEVKDIKGNDLMVEGRKYVIQHELREGAQAPTPIQVIPNYINAIAKIGGSSFQYTDGTAFLKVKKDGKGGMVRFRCALYVSLNYRL